VLLEKWQVVGLRKKLQAALEKVSEELGWKLSLGSCKYSSVAEFKLEAAPIGDTGEAVSKVAEDFKKLARVYGFKPEDLGRQFQYGGYRFELLGLNIKYRKYPVLAKRIQDGKQYKLPIEVASIMAAQK